MLYVRFDFVGLTSRVKSILISAVLNVRTGGAFLFLSILTYHDPVDPTLIRIDRSRFLQWYLKLNLHCSLKR